MLHIAKNVQGKAVDQLIALTSVKHNIVFRAPTGSGKTHMMADYMDRLLDGETDIIFLVSSLSKGGLAEQNFHNFDEYSRTDFKNIEPYLIDSEGTSESIPEIPLDYNVYVLPRDLYKNTANLVKNGTMIKFLEEVTKQRKQRVFLVKDECHIATNKLDELDKYFDKVINFSATPNLTRRQVPDVVISDNDAERAGLIKTVKYMPYVSEGDMENSLDDALSFFERKRQEYLANGISPCMIIQISNKDKADDEWEMIRNVLSLKHQNLKWMLIVNKNGSEDSIRCDTNDEIKKKGVPVARWKEYARGNASTIDIIIFKMVISEGWDIPRACMLFQVRDTTSKQLDEQVIGRVRRNPMLLRHSEHNDKLVRPLLIAYVWGVAEKNNSTAVEIRETLPAAETELEVTPILLKDELPPKEYQDLEQRVMEIAGSNSNSVSSRTIFDIYQQYKEKDDIVKSACQSYINQLKASQEKQYQEAIHIMSNIGQISAKILAYECDYDKSMTLGEPKSVPCHSKYDTDAECTYESFIDDWIWKKSDCDDDNFLFDSEAEKDWANELRKISKKINNNNQTVAKQVTLKQKKDKVFLWGKNYEYNSEIGYQYYLSGIHTSYPDFILKDNNNVIHLFEVKSVNTSGSQNIDANIYNEKVNALKKCYKFASKKVNYHFWIPIKNGNAWDIFHYYQGEEAQMGIQVFERAMLS